MSVLRLDRDLIADTGNFYCLIDFSPSMRISQIGKTLNVKSFSRKCQIIQSLPFSPSHKSKMIFESFLFLKKFELFLNLTTKLECMTECRYLNGDYSLHDPFLSAVGAICQVKTIWILLKTTPSFRNKGERLIQVNDILYIIRYS